MYSFQHVSACSSVAGASSPDLPKVRSSLAVEDLAEEEEHPLFVEEVEEEEVSFPSCRRTRVDRCIENNNIQIPS